MSSFHQKLALSFLLSGRHLSQVGHPAVRLSTSTVAAAFLAVVSLGSFALAWRDEPKTSLTVIPRHHHFGSVSREDNLSHVFTITNETDRAAIIQRTPTSCSCTVAESIVGRSLQPGEHLPFRIAWSVGDQQGEAYTDTVIEYHFTGQNGAPTSEAMLLRLSCVVIPRPPNNRE